ncbi:hypothetical protein FBY35_4095 [Streptomyces sp. SLBN-118]|uniref:DUF6479 family protein n=1 Tax=Streptomyces sp. SLBN-118 TaxID=2768454 RepID=UPI00114DA78B|nr:DUF6479 family protein [Streptomyces sp. SLBN-118]TQK42667.1 hypothetical protein FBY35_4095 [Streptomyces sp. SLBN-118]
MIAMNSSAFAFGRERMVGVAAENEWMAGIAPFIVGIVVVVFLIGLVGWGIKRGRGLPARRGEQPRRLSRRTPIAETREADDFGSEGERLTPHELRGYGNQGSRPARDGERPKHDGDSG